MNIHSSFDRPQICKNNLKNSNLLNLNSEISNLSANITSKDPKDIPENVSKTSQDLSSNAAILGSEKSQIDYVSNLYQEMMSDIWHINDQLFPIYISLFEMKSALEKLVNLASNPERTKVIRHYLLYLIEIENDYLCNYHFSLKFSPDLNHASKSAISNLVSKCYELIRNCNVSFKTTDSSKQNSCLDLETLATLSSKLSIFRYSLTNFTSEFGHPVETFLSEKTIELDQFQHEIADIRNIPTESIEIKNCFEICLDLIHYAKIELECIDPSGFICESLTSLINSAIFIRDSVLSHLLVSIPGKRQVSIQTIHALQENLHDSEEVLKAMYLHII